MPHILYIHMTGAFGGSSRSLYEAVQAMPGDVKAHFITPKGSVEPYFQKLGDVQAVRGLSRFDNTAYSYYRGFRWLVFLRELLFLPLTYWAVRKAYQNWPQIDLIHVNEFTGLFPLIFARRLYGAIPVIVHVRSVMRPLDQSWTNRFMMRVLKRYNCHCVAIDETVKRSMPEPLLAAGKTHVIHNAFTPRKSLSAGPAPSPYGEIPADHLKIGFMGNLLKVKGIDDLIEAARLVKRQRNDVTIMIIGDDAAPSQGYKAKLLKALGLQQNMKQDILDKVERYGLQDMFRFYGFQHDIKAAYDAMDVLCFPSHFNAPGRPVFEAAFSKVPSIVAVTDPTDDTLQHHVTGLAIPPHASDTLAQAILYCADNRDNVKEMGEKAFALAKSHFTVETNATKLYELYKFLISF
jgi:glycosyltransferase involved in cell wall biosynthesis